MSDPSHRDRTDPATEGAARHGVAVPRGQAAGGARGGRYGRMFPHLPERDAGAAAIRSLVKVFRIEGRGPNAKIPAGYTYLGQFIDHDITFDPLSKLQRDNDPEALVNFRTPRFDLDSLYGSGPRDQPYLYDWSGDHPGVKLLVGRNHGADEHPVDLPRNDQGRALLGDARNDENLIVSQLHLLFVQFHNKVVDCLHARDPPIVAGELFDEAQRTVRWHYQWIVAHDYLRRIVGQRMADSVLRPAVGDDPPTVARRYYTWQDQPAIPVEFSAAAYRFGHSMVRHEYFIDEDPATTTVRIFHDPVADPQGLRPHLGGFRRLPAALKLQWDLFFFTSEDRRDRLNPSMRIDTSLAKALFTLPPDNKTALASLNLQRGRALGLPSGADVAHAMGLEALDDAHLPLTSIHRPPGAREALRRATPLWFYVLCEAESPLGNHGEHLGPVGGRIVAEVLVGLLEGDPQSYLRQSPNWTPALPRARAADFTMLDLVEFTLHRDPQVDCAPSAPAR